MNGIHGVHGTRGFGFWSELAAGAAAVTTPVVGLPLVAYNYWNASGSSSAGTATAAATASGQSTPAPRPGTQTSYSPPAQTPPQVSPGVFMPTAPSVDTQGLDRSLDQSAAGISVQQVVTAGLLLTAAGGALYWAFKG